jgi:hypothetical protein
MGFLKRLVQTAVDAVQPNVEEVKQDVVANAKAFGGKALDVTIFVLVGIVGYVLCMLALCWLLAPLITMPGALAAIGGIHVAIGVYGVVRRLRADEAKAHVEPTEAGLETPPAAEGYGTP